jgi:hypothetical protein
VALAPVPSPWSLLGVSATASKLGGASSTSRLTSASKTMAGGASMTRYVDEVAGLAPAPSPWFLCVAATGSKASGTSSTLSLSPASKTITGSASMTGGLLPAVDAGPRRLTDGLEVAGLCEKRSCACGSPSSQCRWARRMWATMRGEEGDVAGEGRGNEEKPRV